jgi:hypothetical protein
MVRRSGSFSATVLLALLLGAMLFVRLVDLHWHQHLDRVLAMADGTNRPLTYIADASTPHLAADQDHDVRMFGDDGSLPAAFQVPDWTVALIVLAPLLLVVPPGAVPHPKPRTTTHRYRSPQLPPPLRGPPR